GGVHASQRHLRALIDLAAREGLERVVVHAFTDGRDSRPDAALGVMAELETAGVTVGTVVGRYYAMDRDHRWERTKRAYDAMVHGIGTRRASAREAVSASYAAEVGDEFIEPAVIGPPDRNRIRGEDAVIFFNFRPDRARQLTIALTERD